MKTEFKFYDDNNVKHDANLVLAFTCENGKQYIIYELADINYDNYDVMLIGEYSEEEGKPFVNEVSDEDNKMVKKAIDNIFDKVNC